MRIRRHRLASRPLLSAKPPQSRGSELSVHRRCPGTGSVVSLFYELPCVSKYRYELCQSLKPGALRCKTTSNTDPNGSSFHVMHTTPVSLLERLRGPEEQAAWTRFVQLYTPLLCHWAKRLGARAEEVSDLVQDVFTVLAQRLPGFQYDPQKRFRGWL